MTAQPTTLTGLDLRAEIDRLRKEKNAVILAHYYQKVRQATFFRVTGTEGSEHQTDHARLPPEYEW